MTEYKIERFDSILNGEIGNIALPVIYIKTDQEFLEFAKKKKCKFVYFLTSMQCTLNVFSVL